MEHLMEEGFAGFQTSLKSALNISYKTKVIPKSKLA